MTTMTCWGATVELAVADALQSLNVSREDIEIEVIDKGRKGFLGFGVKQAEVIVTVIEKVESSSELETNSAVTIEHEEKLTINNIEAPESIEDPIEETKKYLADVAAGMGIKDFKITHKIDAKHVNFQLESSQAALLIGKRGQTLNALQQLAQLIVNKSSGQFKVVRIDVGDYRDRRKKSLELLAERMADSAIRSGQKVQLEPMPSYERKVIHHTLSKRLDIETHSEGSDPYRYLVIKPIK